MKFLRLAILLFVIVLILALAAVSVGRLRRHWVLSEHAEPGKASSSTAPSNKDRIDTQRYRLDSSQSQFIAHAVAGGFSKVNLILSRTRESSWGTGDKNGNHESFENLGNMNP